AAANLGDMHFLFEEQIEAMVDRVDRTHPQVGKISERRETRNFQRPTNQSDIEFVIDVDQNDTRQGEQKK
ncbi:MAG: hypothetical protein ABW006_07535, partial [Hyphomicrobium sp.]